MQAHVEVVSRRTETLWPLNFFHTYMTTLADGTIVVDFHCRRPGDTAWQALPYRVWPNCCTLRDGAFLTFDHITRKVDEGVYEGDGYRADDPHAYCRGKAVDFKPRFHVPQAQDGYDDGGRPISGVIADHGLVELADGALLCTAYGWFHGDKAQARGFRAGTYKYRTFLCRSEDRGQTWRYFADLACDPEVGKEGFCEADLVQLPNGELFCVMRTGGSVLGVAPSDASGNGDGLAPLFVAGSRPSNFSWCGDGLTPLYACRSRDGGLTWTTPVSLGVGTVWPHLAVTRNGILACSYGRPGNHIMFSADNGHSWGGHCPVSPAAQSTGYTCLRTIGPNEVVMSYDFLPKHPRENTVKTHPPVTWQQAARMKAEGTPLPTIEREGALAFIMVKLCEGGTP